MTEKSLTTKEAAERLGVTAPRIRQLVMRDQLPATKFGRDLMIKESDLQRFIAARKARSARRKAA